MTNCSTDFSNVKWPNFHQKNGQKLNISDDQWNSIVQENLKKFEQEKIDAKNRKFERNKIIQEEQMRQVEEKKKHTMDVRNREKAYF